MNEPKSWFSCLLVILVLVSFLAKLKLTDYLFFQRLFFQLACSYSPTV